MYTTNTGIFSRLFGCRGVTHLNTDAGLLTRSVPKLLSGIREIAQELDIALLELSFSSWSDIHIFADHLNPLSSSPLLQALVQPNNLIWAGVGFVSNKRTFPEAELWIP